MTKLHAAQRRLAFALVLIHIRTDVWCSSSVAATKRSLTTAVVQRLSVDLVQMVCERVVGLIDGPQALLTFLGLWEEPAPPTLAPIVSYSPASAPAGTLARLCDGPCGRTLVEKHFSATQWRDGSKDGPWAGKHRCKECTSCPEGPPDQEPRHASSMGLLRLCDGPCGRTLTKRHFSLTQWKYGTKNKKSG